NWTIVTSLMRSPRQRAFNAHDLRMLRCVEPLLRGIAERHWRTDERLKAGGSERNEKAVLERTVQDALEKRGIPPLTPRELEVVGLVLEGHSSESIANILGITAGTVRIHRKNIYAKMRISSQRELFAIFMTTSVLYSRAGAAQAPRGPGTVKTPRESARWLPAVAISVALYIAAVENVPGIKRCLDRAHGGYFL